MKKIVVALLTVLCGASAFADQCAYNSRTVAQTARAILVNQDFVYKYCELCGDEGPTEYPISSDNSGTVDGKAIHFRDRGANESGTGRFWEFAINETAKDGSATTLDLAYTYILIPGKQPGKGTLVNVGAILKCSFDGVKAQMPEASPIKRWNPSKVNCSTGACG